MGQNLSAGEWQGQRPQFTDPKSLAALRAVRAILAHLGLPVELIFEIMTLAEYYPSVSGAHDGEKLILTASGGCPVRGSNCAARMCVLTPPLPPGDPGETWRARRVTWNITSHDQGWGGEHRNTFQGAFSWYEACIIRPTMPDPHNVEDALRLKVCEPKDAQRPLEEAGYTLVARPGSNSFTWLVQCNRVAKREFTEYHVEWAAADTLDTEDAALNGYGTGDGFIEALRPGDMVGLWMRALYPGWANYLQAASVEVVFDVY
ncbi:hypothetical protein C8Q79DRAFT_1009609 [Trametes meyenii]|nr:hypothetical protein C8Q79DRAFT_1009609 [Trametes meyenii]